MAREGKAPAFQFYPADWLADEDVRAMSLAARGAYIDLLAFAWREGSAPDDVDKCARLLGASPREMASVWSAVRARFVTNSDGRLVSARMEEQRDRANQYRAAQQQKGIASAAARAAAKQPNGNNGAAAVAAAVESRFNSASASASAKPLPPARDPWGTEPMRVLWEAARIGVGFSADGFFECDIAAGKVRDTANARGVEPGVLAAQLLRAWPAMCAEWAKRSRAPKGRGPKKFNEHFAAIVEWLDGGGREANEAADAPLTGVDELAERIAERERRETEVARKAHA